MRQYRLRRNTWLLWALVVAATGYGASLAALHTLTGRNQLDGILGVLLGLYICSHPAANLLDVILYGRVLGFVVSRRANALWLALNGLVMLSGWLVIWIGTTRFVIR